MEKKKKWIKRMNEHTTLQRSRKQKNEEEKEVPQRSKQSKQKNS